MNKISPFCVVVIFFITMIATWFVSYRFTIDTLDVEYDSYTRMVWVMDYYGNLEHYNAHEEVITYDNPQDA